MQTPCKMTDAALRQIVITYTHPSGGLAAHSQYTTCAFWPDSSVVVHSCAEGNVDSHTPTQLSSEFRSTIPHPHLALL